MPALRSALIAIVLAALSFISAGGYGHPIYRRLGPGRGTSAEEIILSAALGYGVLAMLMMGLGLVGAWTLMGSWIILLGGIALGIPFIKVIHRLLSGRTFETDSLGLAVALCLVWGILLALSPITYYDSLVYHFAIPGAYVRAGHWISLKELIYPAFPQNLEMLWTFSLLIGNDTVANFISLTLALLTVSAVGAYAMRFFSRQESRLAVLLLAAMPAFLLLSSGGYVDCGLTLFTFLAFYALSLWWETEQTGVLALSGILGGLAMGIKYTAAIPFIAGALLLLWHGRRRPAHVVTNVLLYIGIGFLVVSPWLVKNFVYVGNPVFPFFYKWGNPKLNPWVQDAAAGYFRGLAEYKPASWATILRLPWDIAVRSIRFGGGMDILGDYGWAPFVLLIPCLLFCRKLPRMARLLAAYSVLFFIPWAVSRPVLRFLLPLAPVLCLLSAVAWTGGVKRGSSFLRGSAKAAVAALLLVGVGFFFFVASAIQPFPVALGLESREHYLGRQINYYNAAHYINQLPEATLVFVLGDQRGYYYNKPVIVTPVFNRNPFVDLANGASSPEELDERLKSQHVTHLLINYSEWNRLDGVYHLFPFTEKGLANWDGLRNRIMHSKYRDLHCEVFAL